MFVGHYSVAFAAKTEHNKIQLWVLFVAVQLLDYIWATLVLLGIEKLRVITILRPYLSITFVTRGKRRSSLSQLPVRLPP